MITIRSKIIFLITCIVETALLLAVQAAGIGVLLLPCLGLFIAIVCWASIKGMAMPVLLYFLPFASLLKLQPGTISFYTVSLMLVYMIYCVKGMRNINIYHIVPALCLIGLAFAVKTVNGYPLENSFILFSVTILLIPFIIREFDGEYDFYWLTIFFSLGIIIAAITAIFLADLPNIVRFIGAKSLFGLLRLSGYYGDPNFYSAHITAAISGLLFIIFKNEDKKRMVIIVFTIIALVYCGFLSVSKSFLLVTLCVLIVWVVEFMFLKGKMSVKLMIFLTIFIAIAFFITSTLFTDLIGMMLSRFTAGKTLSDFTTGRTDIWMQYMEAFKNDPLLLIFGKGYSSVNVNDRASHNTIIQMFYQFGIIGSPVLVVWFVCYLRTLLHNTRVQHSDIAHIFLLLIGTFGPWMALDLMFFDEFFLLPAYVCVAVRTLDIGRSFEVKRE